MLMLFRILTRYAIKRLVLAWQNSTGFHMRLADDDITLRVAWRYLNAVVEKRHRKQSLRPRGYNNYCYELLFAFKDLQLLYFHSSDKNICLIWAK